jgi:hypothetical protein
LGKLHAAQGDEVQSRESFVRADHLRRTWKTRVALWLNRVSPNLLKAICSTRV